MSQTLVGVLSVVYLSGIYSSAWVGSLADKLGRRKVLWASILLTLGGLLLTLFNSLGAILAGMAIFTFGFFGAHSVASSWIGRRAQRAKGQATSLYVFSYYVGSSLAGTLGGLFWHHYGWEGIGLFIGTLLVLAVAVALHLSRLPALPGNAIVQPAH
jgi:YNFM family putative membrane transporter